MGILEFIENASRWYSSIHGWVALIICSFGIVNNILNVVVLTRYEMRTPTNLILAAIAVADAGKRVREEEMGGLWKGNEIDEDANHPFSGSHRGSRCRYIVRGGEICEGVEVW